MDVLSVYKKTIKIKKEKIIGLDPLHIHQY